MSLYFNWTTSNIVAATSTTVGVEADLGENCDFVQVILPALNSCTISVQVSDQSGGTFQALGNGITTGTTTGSYSTMLKLGGYRYIKIICSAAQSNATIKVRGMKI